MSSSPTDSPPPSNGSSPERLPRVGAESLENLTRSDLIYCGLCGALNPSTNFYCAACGTTLVDAFHASEGLRVFERPDAASRLIEIVPAGQELEIVEDPNAPSDYVRIRLPYGRLGYIRLLDVEALAQQGARPVPATADIPDINYRAKGCVTPTAALGALALGLVTSLLGMLLLIQSDSADVDVIAVAFCAGVVPLNLLTIALFLYARNREERAREAEEARDGN